MVPSFCVDIVSKDTYVMPECMISLLAAFCGWERLGMCMTLVLGVMAMMLLLGKWENAYWGNG